MIKKAKILFFLVATLSLQAQITDIGANMPQITRPEKSVAGLMAFEEIPVSNYTGIPNVNIPLFSLPTRSKDITMSMLLGYHPASAVMYDAESGDCGLGWSLFSGGVISRTLINKPDEYNNGYNEVNSKDIYQFNFNGNTGRFFIDKATNGTLSVRILDNANSKLVFNLDYNITTSVINSITVFDEKGYKFIFQTNDTQIYVNTNLVSYKSAFHLTFVYDNNNQELIRYNYNNYIASLGDMIINPLNLTNHFKKESEIIVNGYGKVLINYSEPNNSLYHNSIKINSFELHDYNNVLKKKILMNHAFSKLASVVASSPDNSITDKYELLYKNQEIEGGHLTKDAWGYKKFLPCLVSYPLPSIIAPDIMTKYITNDVLEEMILPTGGKVKFDYVPNTHTKFNKIRGLNGLEIVIDSTGYHGVDFPHNYNFETIAYKEFTGTINNTLTFSTDSLNESECLIYTETIPFGTDTNNDGILEMSRPVLNMQGNFTNLTLTESSIDPTSYNFGNQYDLIPNRSYTITINAPRYRDAKGKVHVIKRTKKANPHKVIYGAGIRINNISYFDKNSSTPVKTINYDYNLFDNPVYSSGIICYPTREIDPNDTHGEFYITDENNFTDETLNQKLNREPIGYSNVMVSQTGLGNTKYSYTTSLDYNGFYPKSNTNPIQEIYYDYRRGLLKEAKVFNENNDLLAESNYQYSFVEGSTTFYNNPALNERLGWAKLTSKTSKSWFANATNPVITSENFVYDDNLRKVIKHTTTNTLGETVETNTTYHTGNSPFSQNRIAEVSEMNITKNGVQLGRSKVNYSNSWSGNQSHLPASFESAKATQGLQLKTRITAYDQYSNPTEVRQENGTFSTYIWGYNKTQVIAQISNAANGQVLSALGVSSLNLINESNLTAINNLRNNPSFANSFITTATYIPLVGVATITDAKGDVLRYEYDAINRLKAVRDKNNNILSESQYYIASASITNDLNSVLNTTYKIATTTTLTSPTATQALQNKVFLDGLGRPIQEIAHRQSNTGKDIVSHIEYDQYGRATKSYMPYVNAAASLNFNTNAKNDLLSFYNSTLNVFETTQNPYSETLYDNSPLNRVLEQAAPGNDWNLNNSTKRTVRNEYLTNTTADAVNKYLATAQESTFGTLGYFDTTLTQSGTYAESDLYKSIIKNENWKTGDGNNNTVHQFKNKEGQLLLVRTFGVSDVGASGIVQEQNVAHDTYYVHDQYGNLTYTIPPKANGAITTNVLNNLCYQYRYDNKNRLVEKKIPGKAWEYLVYDKLDRVAAMGPTLSPFTNSTGNGWLIAKYDASNRKILTAWLAGTISSATRKTLQASYDLTTVVNETKTTADISVNGVAFRYTNAAHPTTAYHVLTVNYFDDYNYTGAPTAFTTPVLGQPVAYNNTTAKPKGLATGSWVRVAETTNLVRAERSHILYDYKARAIRSRKTNHLGGYTQVDALLDFAGKTNTSEIRHKRLNANPEIVITENFSYTDQDRLTKHTHRINGGTIHNLSQNTYNELGQLISKGVGGTANALQKIDFTYNIRGWLKAINNVNNLNQGTDPQDLFAYQLNYNTPLNDAGHTVEGLYNGNVSESYWKTASDNKLRKYGYQYDHQNRLKDAKYQMPNEVNKIPGTYNESIFYDKNGNITALKRTGHNPSALLIDDLKYFYNTDSNVLTKVTDTPTTNSSGFGDGTNTGDDFSYDTYGNLTKDFNKGIGTATTDGIFYNHLNQPTTINKSGNILTYTYNAAGQKVAKTVLGATTDYLDGFQYKNGVLEIFAHAEGFINHTAGVYTYVYQYKDQLGNVRISYADSNNNGIVANTEILEENHYYPYGLKHAGYGASDASPAHKNQYNSKEWQDELGINYTAMDFRLYDNALGRFIAIDALAEQYHTISPYQFGNNNPIFWADPTGLYALKFEWDYEDVIIDRNSELTNTARNGIGGGGGGGASWGSGFGSSGFGGGGSSGVNVVVLDANGKDENATLNLEAIKQLDPSVLIIKALNIDDFFKQLIEGLSGSKISNLIFLSHGSYGDTGFFIGSNYLNTNSEFKNLGTRLKPYVTSETNIAFTACHIGAGHDPKSSKKMLQHLADSSGSNILASMTWGKASKNRFNNNDNGESKPNYPIFNKLPKIDKDIINKKTNAVLNLGNFLLLKPNSSSTIINGVYFTNMGNIKY